jgi:hypothetical protein
MDVERKRILDKVSKLLMLASSTNHEGEKANAEKMVARLIANYEINSGEFDEENPIVTITESLGDRKRRDKKELNLLNTLCIYCGVYLVSRQYKKYNPRTFSFYSNFENVFVGKQKDIDAAKYMFNVINPQVVEFVEKWYRDKKREGYSAKHKNDYHKGLIHGISYNLDKINNGVYKYKKESGLVPVNKNVQDLEKAKEQFTKNNKVKSEKDVYRLTEAYNSGQKDSEKISLRKPLESESDKRLRIGN